MVELARFPADFDGIIAGDPYFDIGGEIVGSLVAVQAQLRTPQAALTPAQLSQVDRIVNANCDAADGVSDGLIQNPARCEFDPRKDLPKCGADATGEQCFTQDQINSLSAMFSALTDPAGKVIYPGYPVADLNDAGPTVDNLAFWVAFREPPDTLQGPEPWSRNPAGRPLGWSFANPTMRYLIYADEAGFNTLETPGITFSATGAGPVDGFHAVVPRATSARLMQKSAAGNGNEPAAAAAYFQQGRKLILYHGLADGDITPYRTIQYYETLAKLHGGYGTTQNTALLFLVPAMAHCGGGPGPNVFGQTGVVRATESADNDVLAALESWVEKGHAPKSIVATKYDQDDPKRAVLRTMPLCPFPAMARYKGAGDINAAGSWSCSTADQRLLDVGHAGRQAGSDAALN
jgi:feruloyl esterase